MLLPYMKVSNNDMTIPVSLIVLFDIGLIFTEDFTVPVVLYSLSSLLLATCISFQAISIKSAFIVLYKITMCSFSPPVKPFPWTGFLIGEEAL